MADDRTKTTGSDVDDERGFEPGRAPVSSVGERMPRIDPVTAEYPELGPRDEATRDREPGAGPSGPSAPAQARPGLPTRGLRALFWLVATIGVVMLLVFGAQQVGWLPEFKNPFAKQTTDRSQPPLLKSIQDLSRYVAAEGNFQVIIDNQQNRKYIPDFLLNDRILFVAAGSVDAYVDFGTIGQGAIKESADHKTAEITLPAPQLGKPNLDFDNSRIFSQQRGGLNRIKDLFASDPNRMQEVYKQAEEKIAEAAISSGLRQRAEENTRKMLESLLKSLGYTTVTVKFEAA
jgi:hypothetical protein